MNIYIFKFAKMLDFLASSIYTHQKMRGVFMSYEEFLNLIKMRRLELNLTQ
jgi:hypothetical protein